MIETSQLKTNLYQAQVCLDIAKIDNHTCFNKVMSKLKY